MKSDNQSKGLIPEIRLMVQRARQVWQLVPRTHKVALTIAALIMSLTSICNTAMPVLMGMLVDEVIRGLQQGLTHAVLYRQAALVLGLIALAYVAREGLHVLRRYLVENTITRINRNMQVQMVAHVMKLDLSALTKDRVGTLHGRIFRNVDGFVRFLRLGFLDFFPAILTGLFALSAAVAKQPIVGLVMLGVIPMAVYLTVRQLMSQKGVRLQLMRSCEEIDGAMVEQLGALEYVRAANTFPQEIRRLEEATEKRRALEIWHHFKMSLFGCAKALNEGFFHILILSLAIYLAITQAITPGDVLTFSILFMSVMSPLSEVHRVIDEGHESSLRVGDLLEMLAEPEDRSFTPVRVETPRLEPGKPILEIDNLQVEYTTVEGQRKRALDGLSLTVRHGETIGLAGRSGGGKSTWVKVLLRLTHPCGGTVMLGGVPLESISREDIGRYLGYVGQSPFVFSGTIADNISYGTGPTSPEQIRRAAHMARLHDEIMMMPGGYEAIVSERGQNLSGGQRQRLAIARVLLKNPALLILDEATSALDNISERHVQRFLGLTNVNRTTILVAHRLTTLRDADRILVFDGGRIVEVGTYDDLVQQGGVFAELVVSAEKGVLDPAAVHPPAEEFAEVGQIG